MVLAKFTFFISLISHVTALRFGRCAIRAANPSLSSLAGDEYWANLQNPSEVMSTQQQVVTFQRGKCEPGRIFERRGTDASGVLAHDTVDGGAAPDDFGPREGSSIEGFLCCGHQ